jgi:hypothetical protein
MKADEEKKPGRFPHVSFKYRVGIYVLMNVGWILVAERNTRQGFKLIARLAETCELWNAKFSVYLERPEGKESLEVILDVPQCCGKDRMLKQRACLELFNRERVDFLEWLEMNIPRTDPEAQV